ncbi:MAG: VCBS repeat-containing protein, partial [Patescibacteria group bacterium]
MAWLLSALRAILPWTLAGLLVVSGWRYFTRPLEVGALEFTPRVVNGATTAVGVQGVAATDMDADGDIDVVTTGKDGTKVYINDGKEKFETRIVDDKYGERVQVIDLNKDGTPDLLVTLKNDDP